MQSGHWEADDERQPLFHRTHFNFGNNRRLYNNRRGSSERSEYYGPLSPGHAEGIPVEISHGEHTISAKYESQDYDTCENTVFLDEERNKKLFTVRKDNISRWVIMALVDVDKCVKHNCLLIPYLLWLALNAGPVFLAAILACVIEPVAAGSGIPEVKCYLNGVKIPRIVRFRTLLAKTVGVTLSVVGGLAVGKEGPMIHSGAVIAAGISQGRSTSFGKDFKVDKIFTHFRSDREKRDFVSGGAAAGVSAAFGAPVGGVLFSLEEGASFWNQELTWRIFFCSMMSTFTLSIILSAYYGKPAEFNYNGLLNFGKFDEIPYKYWELFIFMFMGAIGGLFGAIFNSVNRRLTIFRIRHVHKKSSKVVEAIIVAVMSATVGFLTIYLLNDCQQIGQDPTLYSTQFYCGDGEYNAVAALWFQTPEATVRSLFHDPARSHRPLSLFIFFVLYFLLSCWTYGLGIPSGLFIPSLLTGAAWGRLVGILLQIVNPALNMPGKYALIGAAAQLGGVVRMTLSLTVIMIEATGNITFGLPLMIALIAAKWVGDYFNEGIYDMHIHLANVPLLAWEPPPLVHKIYASEIMSHPVIAFYGVEKVGHIVAVLQRETHNGFPIVRPAANDSSNGAEGHYRGLILRSQLITLLQARAFIELEDDFIEKPITMDNFRANYPVTPSIEDVIEKLSPGDENYSVDLTPYMNPASYTVLSSASLPRIFRLFRGLGLRHLVVVTEYNEVIGIVTRKDLARYRVNVKGGESTLEELQISFG
uniref:Chloride channel protein n=1 Tax=Strigamia maritima TaxID=126957 RepID=T1J037_STRMM